MFYTGIGCSVVFYLADLAFNSKTAPKINDDNSSSAYRNNSFLKVFKTVKGVDGEYIYIVKYCNIL